MQFSPFASTIHELPNLKATTSWLLWVRSAQTVFLVPCPQNNVL